MGPHRSPQFPDRDGRKTPDQGTHCEDDDDDEEESSEGATAAPSAGASGLSASLLQDGARLAGRNHGIGRMMTSPLFRMPENVIIGVGVGAEGRSQTEEQAKDKPAPSRDPERLRKIQERSEGKLYDVYFLCRMFCWCACILKTLL